MASFDPLYFYKNPKQLLPALAASVAGFFAGGPAGAVAGFVTVAAATLAQATFIKRPELESDFDRVSPTYGFNRWDNRTKGDTVLPIIYAGHPNGHRTAPIYVQVYATPRGEQDDDFSKVLKARGQGISGLMAVCEGPIDKLEDVRFNDEPVFEKIGDTSNGQDRKRIGTGNGSRKVFTFNAKRAVLDTFEVYVGGTLKGWTHEERTYTYANSNSATTIGRARIVSDERIAMDREISVAVDGVTLDSQDETTLRPHVWMENEYELRLNMQQTYQTTTSGGIASPRITVTYYVLKMDGLAIEHNGSGEWTLRFDTAPASAAKIEVTYLRKMFNGLEIDWRNGAEHQLHIPGFESIRNAIPKNVELTSTATTLSTENEVDNLILNLSSGQGGFTQYDDEGNRDPVEAQFKIEVKRTTASTGAPNTYDSWTTLYDPTGAKKGKTTAEFRCRGDSIAQLFYSFSIKGILAKYLQKKPNSNTARTMLNDFVRAKYDVRLTRTNTVQANSNSLFIDNIYWQTLDEVIDERLSYPGVAMLGFHALASDKLQGSAPNVTCRVRGIRNVEAWDGSAWAADADNQGNRVWACVDVLTNRRYGAGDHFTKASNIDTTSALAAANWLDETVPLEGNATEVRSRLDVVLDTRKSPIQWAMDILRPGRVFPVLQGNLWKFVIDDGVTLSTVPVVYEDTTAQRVARPSVRLAHDSEARKATELQTRYLDEDEDFEFREVWISPDTPATDRRITQAELIGITRRSEATRASNALYKQMTAGGLGLEFIHAPGALEWEAGDVIRFISSRMGIDDYWRVGRLEFGTSDYFVRTQLIPYVRALYGQQDQMQQTRRTGVTITAPLAPVIRNRQTFNNRAPTGGTAPRRRTSRMIVRVRRVS